MEIIDVLQMIPQIGIESAPADLLTWLLVNYFRRSASTPTSEAIFASIKVKGKPSGGTLATVLSVFEHYSISHLIKSSKPYALSPVSPQNTLKVKQGFWAKFVRSLTGIRSVPEFGTLMTSVNGGTDRTIVYRSWGLIDAGAFYGPKFRFSPYAKANNIFQAMVMHWALAFGAMALLLKPVRWLVKKNVYAPGQGPTRE